jgi:phosphoribosylanthranilate isomerase
LILRTRIKICGLTREADVAAAVDAGADAIGFVLYAKSPRHVSLDRAVQLARALPPFDETAADCDAAMRAYLRAVRMAPGVDLLDFAQRFPTAAAVLLDADVEGYGGGGKRFDWSLIPAAVPRPLVLSGGLSPANVIDGVLAVRPYAVDVSSGVESEKGIKDAALIRRFCEAVREADARLADAAN